MIQVISELRQAKLFVQAYNHFDYLIMAKRLKHLKRLGQLVTDQETTIELSNICVSQHYCWHMMIEVEWDILRRKNSPRDIFVHFSHYFQLKFNENFFLCNDLVNPKMSHML